MSLLVKILGGQWLAFFEGGQGGYGLLSFNTFAETGGYISLNQNENAVERTPILLLQGRLNLLEISETAFLATAKRTNQQTPGEVVIKGIREVGSAEWKGTWSSTDNYSGTFCMTRLHARPFQKAEVRRIDNWNEFSDWAFDQTPEASVYRGVGDIRYPLESTAHRAGIFDFQHYLVEILPRVRAELLKRHGLRIKIDTPDGLAEMLALIRHHGFPSPIMDWSKSPWVALYFAITSAEKIKMIGSDLSFCRIYCLGHAGISVAADLQQALLSPTLSGPLIEIPTPMTSRVTAQEGVFLLTPCVDVVSTFVHQEEVTQKQVISAIDVDVGVVGEFLGRLDRMMINEATMLSSIDSTLSHLRKRLVG